MGNCATLVILMLISHVPLSSSPIVLLVIDTSMGVINLLRHPILKQILSLFKLTWISSSIIVPEAMKLLMVWILGTLEIQALL